MAETGAIPVVVLSRQQDPVEIINSTLRNAGHPVHCSWVRDVNALGDALTQSPPHVVFLCIADFDEAAAALDVRRRCGAQIPVILVRDAISEPELTRALELGAQDVVTLQARRRLQAVAARELHAARLDRALAGTLVSARQYRDQMKAFMTGSADAIAHVQEGIIVDANPAWIELFGHSEASALLGQPLMDCFDPRSHTALKGALVAAAQGRWEGHPLQAVAAIPGGTELAMDLELERFDFEGEPAVRLKVPTPRRDVEAVSRQLEEALRFDASTGLLKRSTFVGEATAQAAHPLKAGLRAVAYVELDRADSLEADLGPLAVEELVDAAGRQVSELLQPGDLATRITARGFAVLAERGNTRDLDTWIARVVKRLAEHVYHVGDRSVSITCSAGVKLLSSPGEPLGAPLEAAVRSARSAATAGGNRVLRPEPENRPPEVDEADRTWAGRIKSALMANRFRLVQQPIASLVGDGETMYDLVVRMLDDKGNEVLPSEFMLAAQRTDLMKNIDRWVVGAAMSFCAARKPHRVFVRLSRDSIRDQTLGAWLQQQIKASGVEASRVVVELGEELATNSLKETKQLQELIRPLGFGLAIENFGSGRDPGQLLSHVPVDFVKIDGALMQGIANDRPLQEQVKSLVQEARSRGAATIAERVEDANTMAVLWQLGVEYVQGYFVSSPEDVVLAS